MALLLFDLDMTSFSFTKIRCHDADCCFYVRAPSPTIRASSFSASMLQWQNKQYCGMNIIMLVNSRLKMTIVRMKQITSRSFDISFILLKAVEHEWRVSYGCNNDLRSFHRIVFLEDSCCQMGLHWLNQAIDEIIWHINLIGWADNSLHIVFAFTSFVIIVLLLVKEIMFIFVNSMITKMLKPHWLIEGK